MILADGDCFFHSGELPASKASGFHPTRIVFDVNLGFEAKILWLLRGTTELRVGEVGEGEAWGCGR